MAENDYKIVGYLADWEAWSAETTDADRMTHINYAFARIEQGIVSIGKKNKLQELYRLKQKFPGIKTLISIGGWGVEGFSDAALTAGARDKLAESIMLFIKKYGFDGADLDWEYPGISEAGITARPEDRHNFTLLLEDIREKLNRQGEQDGKDYLLTIASGARQQHLSSLELDAVSSIVDFVNLMTYDFHSGLSKFAGHHANLYTSLCDDGDRMSADLAVRSCINARVPANKLVLGCAFYGRGWTVEEAENNGLYEYAGKDRSEHPYSELESAYIDKNGFTRYWDQSAKAPYLWDGRRFISYEDETSLAYKASYIKSKGLGGVMFWEYTQDKDHILLNRLYSSLLK